MTCKRDGDVERANKGECRWVDIGLAFGNPQHCEKVNNNTHTCTHTHTGVLCSDISVSKDGTSNSEQPSKSLP